MLWREAGIRKVSASETLKILASGSGKDATRAHLLSLLAEQPVKDAVLDLLKELLRHDEVAPLAERVTRDVQQTVELLSEQFDAAFKAEHEKLKEEMRTAVTVQKSSATRQINEHVERRSASIASTVADLERKLDAAFRARKARFQQQIEELETEAEARLDALLERKLTALAADAVRRHIESKPIFAPEFSNRELAKVNRISIREVKRRRRAAGNV